MWVYKETYFSIIEPEMFNMEVPIQISNALGYEGIKYFGEIVWKSVELIDGRWAVSLQLCPNDLLFAEGVNSWISEMDYNIAAPMFDNIITLSEFKQLDFKAFEIEII